MRLYECDMEVEVGKIMGGMGYLWKSRGLSIDENVGMLEEDWTLGEWKRVEVFGMEYWRRVLEVNIMDRIKNRDIRE